MPKRMTFLAVLVLCQAALAEDATSTRRMYLSGKGPSDTVAWDFKVSQYRRAGQWAKIPVPSQWEQHGFGGYDYGLVRGKNARHNEDGLYRRKFTVPADWRGRHVRIVFEGVMTDATVKVNGQLAGPTHQGGFYRFHYDITDKVRYGKQNDIEVLVSKDSADDSVEHAERYADYWIFGGIYRPVWIESRPAQFIEWTAIDARADGTLRAKVFPGAASTANRVVAQVMSVDDKPVSPTFEAKLDGNQPVELSTKIDNVEPWSAESPDLYFLDLTLMAGDKALHRVRERFGFRTIEIRQGKGLFVNGQRIRVKGVDRHCFRPETGRSLDPNDSYDDVRLLKSMNMNAVRCSHYPPDAHFLKACDELGLYVIDELSGWQSKLGTQVGRKLIGEMVRRDVNHPSILWWSNGNEGGWNIENDNQFDKWDIQGRSVIHPWAAFGGFQTKHYPDWTRLNKDLAGDLLVMPTETLHGLFDGGSGAGLEDYWGAISSHANGVGLFLWVMADEGVARTDENGRIDTQGIFAPDGIVGPHHEREASYFTVKDVFCPVQIAMKKLPEKFNGDITVENRYDFRNLSTCTFQWRLRDLGPIDGAKAVGGQLAGPIAKSGKSATIQLPLPENWRKYDVLELTAVDTDKRTLWTWAWPTTGIAAGDKPTPDKGSPPTAEVSDDEETLTVTAADREMRFDLTTGRLSAVRVAGKALGLANGPRLAGDPNATITRVTHRTAGKCLVIEAAGDGQFKRYTWTVHPDGRVDLDYAYRMDKPSPFHGITFDLPEDRMQDLSWVGQGPRRVWKNRMRGTRFGSFEIPYKKLRPGEDFDYPHFRGYYAGVRDATIATAGGSIEIVPRQECTFLRVGTNDEGKRIRTSWPGGDVSILHGIPAIGTKFKAPAGLGPRAQLYPPTGLVEGRVTFRFLEPSPPHPKTARSKN